MQRKEEDEESIASSFASEDFSVGHSEHGSKVDETNSGDKHDLLQTRTENQVVATSKLLVYLVLLLAAGAVGTIAYVLLSNEEEEDFKNEFNALAQEIINVAENNAFNTAGVMKSMSVAISSYVESSSLEAGLDAPKWPFVTIPDWEKIAGESLELSGADALGIFVYLTNENKTAFEEFAQNNQDWISRGLEYEGRTYPGTDTIVDPGRVPTKLTIPNIPNDITRDESELVVRFDGGDNPMFDGSTDSPVYGLPTQMLHMATWQLAPAPIDADVMLMDMRRSLWFTIYEIYASVTEGALLSEIRDLRFLLPELEGEFDGRRVFQPQSMMLQPIYSALTIPGWKDVRAGYLMAVLNWESFFVSLLPERQQGFVVVVDDGCVSVMSYEINGREARYLGLGDYHDTSFDSMVVSRDFAAYARWDGSVDGQQTDGTYCPYKLSVYPSKKLEDSYKTSDPLLYSAVVVCVFFFTGMVFAVYDWTVQRRQESVMSTAQRTTAIVASLFPKNVQERLLQEAEHPELAKDGDQGMSGGATVAGSMSSNGNSGFLSSKNVAAKNQLKDFLHEDEDMANVNGSAVSGNKPSFLTTKPIADLFPNTTIMFADLVGFTAWSSTREPSQVFTLLETIYHAFDVIAKKRRVFKVETVGDCYVAVAGLPEPRKDHAVVMARFARDCLNRLNKLTNQLEETLGPDTADLMLRLGLHSGPVTAGVLRGEKARFQLFGDTMNTASRMETTSKPGRIQLSQETADLLTTAGKGQWLRQRPDKVVAKGKGELTTYWLEIKADNVTSETNSTHPSIVSSSNSNQMEDDVAAVVHDQVEEKQHEYVAKVLSEKIRLTEKHARLVTWNSEVLAGILKEIAGRRKLTGVVGDPPETLRELERAKSEEEGLVLDEVAEIVTLPRFSAMKVTPKQQEEASQVTVSEKALSQLHDFVQAIAALYRDNPFHGFDHASHVTMSVVKLLARIVAPDITQQQLNEQTLHDHTYGITSDPLTQFVCVFAALIHDLDHPGVPNSQLVKERSSLAVAYREKSVAEQNSVDLAWDLLMEEKFVDLRQAIYTTAAEFKRFRQLLVNAVMATDVMDKDLGAARKARWNKAFAEKKEGAEDHDDINRKATIVIEHLIQASDVAHTMQHWHIYRKWNARLFQEMTRAFNEGRADKDPAEFWYKGEIGFFDFYVIPLAKKLKDCGVFGVSSDEYLIYAQKNRQEWEDRGQDIVAEMIEARRK